MTDIYLEIESVPSKLVLAEECWRCHGDGKPMDKAWARDDGLCSPCGGTGKFVTGNGEAILEMLALAAIRKATEQKEQSQ